MKKAFTLLELIIVVIVLGILFSALGYLSWSYIYSLNVKNDKETLENGVSHIQSSSLSQPSFGNYKMLDFIGVKMEKENKYISYIGATGNVFNISNAITVGSDYFNDTKLGTGFDFYSGGVFQESLDEIYFMYKPYNISSFIVKQDGTILTGNKSVKFHIIDNGLGIYKNCLKFEVAPGRLYNITCE